jgi:hypothetical protein
MDSTVGGESRREQEKVLRRHEKMFPGLLVVCPGDSEGCHSEERSDEESQDGRNNARFFASTAFRLRMTVPLKFILTDY